MKTPLLAVLGGLVLLEIAAVPAQAFQDFTGHVTELEPTYMPEKFAFKMDAGNASCPAGKWLWWTGVNANLKDGDKRIPENVREILAIALAAIMSGKVVDFYINDDDNQCLGQYLHLNSGQ